MKTRMIYWATMIITMFVVLSCNNEDDFSDIMNENNLLSESTEVFEANECPRAYEWSATPDYTFYCFDNHEQLAQAGFEVEDTKLLNWRNRTLVMVMMYQSHSLYDFSIKVYSKDGKYVIECIENNEGDYRDLVFDEKCYGILLDEPNVRLEDIELKIKFS